MLLMVSVAAAVIVAALWTATASSLLRALN